MDGSVWLVSSESRSPEGTEGNDGTIQLSSRQQPRMTFCKFWQPKDQTMKGE